MARLRIAIGQISCESNHFITTISGESHFRQTGYLLRYQEVFQLRGSENELAGMMDVLERHDVEIVPLLAARANSTGLISTEFYREFKRELLAPLKEKSGPIDGVLLSCHGSMVVEDIDDPEGDLAAAIRELVGRQTPIMMTLDLHGNVTRRMVENMSAVIAYRQYPHDDTHDVGMRAAKLMLKCLNEKITPYMAHVQLPMILTAFNTTTKEDTPFARLVREAAALEADPEVLSASVFLVGSYIDIEEIGCSVVVITRGNEEKANQLARSLAQRYWDSRDEFHIEPISVAEAVRRGRAIQGNPILLLDTADTTGGGAAGDGIGLVRELINLGIEEPCYSTVVDPAAAAKCIEAGVGAEITLKIGHYADPRWGKPLQLNGKVVKVSNGELHYDGGILGGQTVSMGPTAIFYHAPISLLIMSFPTYDWGDEKFRAVGMDSKQAKFIGVKNMMNFRFGYRDVMKGFFIVDIPGPTPSDFRKLNFKRIRRPMFPFDETILEPIPVEIPAQR